MNQKKTEKKLEELLIMFIYSICILFAKSINSILIFALGIILITYFFKKFKKDYNNEEALVLIMCILMPTSFVSILGTNYGKLPITWFHIITLILLIILVKDRFRVGPSLIIIMLFSIFCVASLFISNNIFNALKQIMTIFIFMLSFFIGEQFVYKCNIKLEKKMKYYYYINIYIFVIMIFIQKIFYENLFVKIGYTEVYANRIVYAAYMSDFSFSNLYVATGALLLLIDFIRNKRISLVRFIIGQFILISGLIAINSRTGLYAFIVIAGLYLIINSIRLNYKSMIIAFIGVITIPFILEIVLELRGGQNLLDSSGRVGSYIEALRIFSQRPLIGIGFGIEQFVTTYNIGVPHNIIVQYLCQMGIIGTTLFISIFIQFYKKVYRYNNEYSWILLMILVGALAIPDIPSSRFLSIIIIMIFIKASENIFKEVKYEK
ncbi:O-antigen ligase family protein [Romboutsia sp.]|uniref:O-antigen ligase family protein n=1 Tax=Romboutsia sp. TaxID=1965302 RepID=UPI003F400011